MKIWHQSFTDFESMPGYARMLTDHARQICSTDTVLDLHGLLPGTYPEGVPPLEMFQYPWVRNMLQLKCIENCIRAEREGYDAVAITNFGDPGLELARSLVDIPVVSTLESTLLVSCTIGRRPGLLALDEMMAGVIDPLIDDYGFRDRLAGVDTLHPHVSEFDLEAGFNGTGDVMERFRVNARRLIAKGADVLIPAEGVLNLLLVKDGLQEVDGVPLLDSFGVVVAMAETLVNLNKRTGLRASRSGVYAKPPASTVAHIRAMTLRALQGE